MVNFSIFFGNISRGAGHQASAIRGLWKSHHFSDGLSATKNSDVSIETCERWRRLIVSLNRKSKIVSLNLKSKKIIL